MQKKNVFFHEKKKNSSDCEFFSEPPKEKIQMTSRGKLIKCYEFHLFSTYVLKYIEKIDFKNENEDAKQILAWKFESYAKKLKKFLEDFKMLGISPRNVQIAEKKVNGIVNILKEKIECRSISNSPRVNICANDEVIEEKIDMIDDETLNTWAKEAPESDDINYNNSRDDASLSTLSKSIFPSETSENFMSSLSLPVSSVCSQPICSSIPSSFISASSASSCSTCEFSVPSSSVSASSVPSSTMSAFSVMASSISSSSVSSSSTNSSSALRRNLFAGFHKNTESKPVEFKKNSNIEEKEEEDLKEDLINMTQQMREVALKQGEILEKDNDRLLRTAEMQQRHIDKTAQSTDKAKKFIKSKKMSFLKEMLILVIGVLCFIFTFFFILVT